MTNLYTTPYDNIKWNADINWLLSPDDNSDWYNEPLTVLNNPHYIAADNECDSCEVSGEINKEG